MKSRNGAEYGQNYDVIAKWLSDALRGETLNVLGVNTGRIEEVFGFEPVEIAVKAGRVDVMARDDTGAWYHIEEQRNLSKSDMYRFAAYHFLGAKQWGEKITDIILASGEVYAGKKTITTGSGKYTPVVIDFTQRDGRKRLAEIRETVLAGTFGSPLELVFLPLYGKETGAARSELAEEVLRFGSDLYHSGKLSATRLAAILIMSNKLIDKDRLKALWEEIKMLDILEIAREKGIQEGKSLGEAEATRVMLVEILIERLDMIPVHVSEQLREIRNPDILRGLFHKALRCRTIEDFESVLKKAA